MLIFLHQHRGSDGNTRAVQFSHRHQGAAGISLSHQFQVLVRKGMGSNPILEIYFSPFISTIPYFNTSTVFR
jgi:hypothetical protein